MGCGVGDGTMIIAPGRGLIGFSAGESARSWGRGEERAYVADRVDFCLRDTRFVGLGGRVAE